MSPAKVAFQLRTHPLADSCSLSTGTRVLRRHSDPDVEPRWHLRRGLQVAHPAGLALREAGGPQRKQVWRNFFNRLKTLDEERNIDFDEIEYCIKELSEYEMNGRQIRNCITTARQLALFKKKKMTSAHIKHAIKVSGKFDTYLTALKEGFSDDQIARVDGVR